MPDWQPNWEDVEFDVAAAQTAAARCREAAVSLDAVGTVVVAGADAVVADWEGDSRTSFEDGMREWGNQRIPAANRLTDLAEQLEMASVAAVQEQAHRESERLRWYDEDRAEG